MIVSLLQKMKTVRGVFGQCILELTYLYNANGELLDATVPSRLLFVFHMQKYEGALMVLLSQQHARFRTRVLSVGCVLNARTMNCLEDQISP